MNNYHARKYSISYGYVAIGNASPLRSVSFSQ